MRVVSEGITPKALATKRRLLSPEEIPDGTVVTGDPQHCIIKVRALISPHVSDGQDFLFDVIDSINRFSSELRPLDCETPRDTTCPVRLSANARGLLLEVVALPKANLMSMSSM